MQCRGNHLVKVYLAIVGLLNGSQSSIHIAYTARALFLHDTLLIGHAYVYIQGLQYL